MGILKKVHSLQRTNAYLYCEEMLKLHKLDINNSKNKDEDEIIYEKICDELDYLSRVLTEKEKEIVEHVSGDLYMIKDEDMFFKVEEKDKYNKNELNKLIESEKWIDVLKMLRWSIGLERELIVKYRIIAYGKLGLENVATAFRVF